MQVTPLFHVTGDPDDQRCYNCGISLAKQRCAGNTTAGQKWFCRQEPESEPDQSCYSFWKMAPGERSRCMNREGESKAPNVSCRVGARPQ
jgi:hypothetical protein